MPLPAGDHHLCYTQHLECYSQLRIMTFSKLTLTYAHCTKMPKYLI